MDSPRSDHRDPYLLNEQKDTEPLQIVDNLSRPSVEKGLVPPPCDSSTACCLPAPAAKDTANSLSFPQGSSVQVPEEVRLDTYETLDRIDGGEAVIRSLPLPWGSAGLFKIPVLGEVYLHVEKSATVHTVEPIRLGYGGTIQSGLLQFTGDVGLTFSDREKREGGPLLYRVETIRFEKGNVFLKFVTMPEVVEDEAEKAGVPDEGGMALFELALRGGLRWTMGSPNVRGEYNFWPFIMKRGWTPYFTALKLKGLAKFLRRKGEIGSHVVSALHPPDYHRINLAGDLTLRNPLYNNLQTAERIEAGRIHYELHPPFDYSDMARLDSVKFHLDHLFYANPLKGIAGGIEDLEFAIRDDFDYRDPAHFSGSGEIRWNNVELHGPKETELALGCVERDCILPQKVSFDFNMTPSGLRVDIQNNENQLYTPDQRIVGRILPSFLNLAIDLRRQDAGWHLGNIELAGAIAVEASTRNPIHLTDTLRADAEGWCHLIPESQDLLSGNLSVGFNCVARGGQIEWFTPEEEMGLRLRILPDTKAIIGGKAEKTGDRLSIEIPSWVSPVDLDAPRIVKAMELIARTTGEKPKMKNIRVILNADGTKEFHIEFYSTHVRSNLISPFFENPMESDLAVHSLKASLAADGSFTLESEDPKNHPYFLQTNATGQILIPSLSRRPFTVDEGHLQMKRVLFDYPAQRVEFKGQLSIVHNNVPEEFLEKRFKIRAPSSRPQKFKISVVADQWALSHSGVVEILSGEVTIEAMDIENGALRKITRQINRPVEMLPIVIPPLPSKKGINEPPLFSRQDLMNVATGLFKTIAKIKHSRVRVPQEPGEIEFSILGSVLTASLVLPQGTIWTVDTQTKDDSKTGEESFHHFVLYPTEPLRLCGKVFGFCITQEELKFRKIELVTKDPVPPKGKIAGELILDVNTSLTPNPVKKLLDLLHIDPDVAEQNGLKIEGNRWRLPLSLKQIEQMFATASPGEGGNGSGIRQIPHLRALDATGRIDVILDGAPYEICPQREGAHPHLFVQMAPGEEFNVWRRRPTDPIRMQTFHIPFIGASFPETHPGTGQKPRLFSDQEFLHSPFFLGVRDFTFEDPFIDLKHGKVGGRIRARDIPFRIGRMESPYYWTGGIEDAEGSGFSYQHSMRQDPLNPHSPVTPVTEVRSHLASYRFHFEKEKGKGARGADFFPVVFSGAPRFEDLYSRLYPNRIEIGYHEVQDTVNFGGRHFQAADVTYRAKDAFLTTPRTDDIAGGDVLIRVPEIDIESGSMTLGTGTLQMVKPGVARGVTLQMNDEQVNLSMEWFDVWWRGINPSFVNALGLPNGFRLENLSIAQMHMAGQVGQVGDDPSFIRRGDIDFHGQIKLEAEGEVQFSYQGEEGIQVDHFRSPLSVHMGNLTHLKTSGGEMGEMQFEDFHLDWNDVDATLAVLDFFKTHLGAGHDPKGQSASRGSIHVKSGEIKISHDVSNEARPRVTLALNGISLQVEGRSFSTEMLFFGAARRKRVSVERTAKGVKIHYPDLKITISASGTVVASRNEEGKWEETSTVDQFKVSIPFKKATIRQ